MSRTHSATQKRRRAAGDSLADVVEQWGGMWSVSNSVVCFSPKLLPPLTWPWPGQSVENERFLPRPVPTSSQGACFPDSGVLHENASCTPVAGLLKVRSPGAHSSLCRDGKRGKRPEDKLQCESLKECDPPCMIFQRFRLDVGGCSALSPPSNY
ncbi:hypothetical protein BX600DRAFT_31083 [Xylariales sp. PMI_506]|nr:hypothetical protein BX600DRAFT_31083 [Xylariales sp. PMI_506]